MMEKKFNVLTSINKYQELSKGISNVYSLIPLN